MWDEEVVEIRSCFMVGQGGGATPYTQFDSNLTEVGGPDRGEDLTGGGRDLGKI